MLHNEMRVQQIVIGTGTIKRQILIQNLQNIQTVFGTVHNELDMLDLLDSSSIVKGKLDKLEQLLKLNIVKNGMPNDDSTLASSSSCFGFATTAAAASPPVRSQPSSSRLFKKSFSYDSKMAQHVAAALGTGINVHQQTTQCRSEK
uniref:BLOC-1-related complex subunit 7 n=1 Tax=Globodera pallida TaxID=36090 RepID=A0A183CJ20_GLOPA